MASRSGSWTSHQIQRNLCCSLVYITHDGHCWAIIAQRKPEDGMRFWQTGVSWLSVGSPAIKTDRGGWEWISWHSKVASNHWQVIQGAWSGDLMGGGYNAGLQTGLNQPPKSPRGSVRHHTCTSCGQEGNDSPTAWLLAMTIYASLNWQFCLPVQREGNLCCRRISDPLSPPKKNNRLNGDQVRTLITRPRSQADGVKWRDKKMLSCGIPFARQSQ